MESTELASLVATALGNRSYVPLHATVAEHHGGDVRRHASSYDELASYAATGFLDGRLSFDDADQIANHLYACMVEDAIAIGESYRFPPYSLAVYEAFDAGEFVRGCEEDLDPIELYTRPLLRDLVSASSMEVEATSRNAGAGELGSLVEELIGLKPLGWSVVRRGLGQISVRPTQRGLGKFSITYSEAERVRVAFFDRSLNFWSDSADLPTDAGRVLQYMLTVVAEKQM